ncbi:hypothetical protein CLV92_10751 [Kineococcus xinjiangensis]|uniref:Uncharacterized protein n=1 Tax=Kineococcus xinjiangensis TaxID=512762 RepID=A0A2S6IK21_9ACTN|nr:hypothetical protein [Kineococcus xinjiangensis]PPK94548.1 hypothetical protein CLV92_10751 [Kineococcus xinjiangensis]
MTELLLPATTLIAVLGATYFFCLRPMRRGRCAMAMAAGAGRSCNEIDSVDRDLAQARERLAQLRVTAARPSSHTAARVSGSRPEGP